MIHEPNEWQHKDKVLGILKPWYVKPFLDVLDTWDLSDKIVFEYGLGNSTIWYAHKAKKVYGVDEQYKWFKEVGFELVSNFDKSKYDIFFEPVGYRYPKTIYTPNIKFDIVVIDGLTDCRDACVVPAIDCVKDGGVIIVDNWMQPSVHMMNEENQRLLRINCEHYEVYKQENHPDWQTAIFKIKR